MSASMAWDERYFATERNLRQRHSGVAFPAQSFHGDEAGLAAGLSRLLPRNGTVAVVVDGVRKEAGGGTDVDEAFCRLLQGLGYVPVLLNLATFAGCDPEDVRASEPMLAVTARALESVASAVPVIALGSGSVTDLVKHALFRTRSERRCISVPTALTVTAFTSAFAVIDEDGLKHTHPSRAVDATLWHFPFVCHAPLAMTRAGFGDMLAACLATADWCLAHRFGLVERFDAEPFDVMEPFLEGAAEHAGALRTGELSWEAFVCLTAGLAMSGVAMNLAASTTPISGFEHAVSHSLDFLHAQTMAPMGLHGEQVALAARVSARVFDWFLAQESLSADCFAVPEPGEARTRIRALLERAARFIPGNDFSVEKAMVGFLHAYEQKLERWRGGFARLPEVLSEWDDIRAEVREYAFSRVRIDDLVSRAELPVTPKELFLPLSLQEFQWAVDFAPYERARVSVGDFLEWMGVSAWKVGG